MPEPFLAPIDPDSSRGAAPAPSYLQCAALVVAATLLAIAIWVRDGSYTPAGMIWLAVAMAVTFIATLAPFGRLPFAGRRSVLVFALFACFMTQFALVMTKAPAGYVHFVFRIDDPATAQPYPAYHHLTIYWALMAIAAVACGSLLRPGPSFCRLIVPLLVGLQMTLSIWLVQTDVTPRIDVHIFGQDAARALLDGRNPYAITFADVYAKADSDRFYGPGVSQNGRIQYGFPYMPLTLFTMLPGMYWNEVRYALAGAVALSVLLIAYARASWLSYAAAAGLLFMPRTLLAINESWTEPTVLLPLALTIFCAVRLPKLTPVAFGLLLASKQYMPFAVLLTPLLFGWDWPQLVRSLCIAGLTAAFVTLPLVLLDVSAFVHSAVMLHLRQPFRIDSLSYLAWWAQANPNSKHLSASIGFVGLIVVAALTLWRLPPSPANFAAAFAASYFVFFAFNEQAFANYYFLVIGALWCAVAAIDLPATDQVSRPNVR